MKRVIESVIFVVLLMLLLLSLYTLNVSIQSSCVYYTHREGVIIADDFFELILPNACCGIVSIALFFFTIVHIKRKIKSYQLKKSKSDK